MPVALAGNLVFQNRWGREDSNLYAAPVMQPGCAHPAGWSTVAPDLWSGVSTVSPPPHFEEPGPEGLLGQPGPSSMRGLRYWPSPSVRKMHSPISSPAGYLLLRPLRSPRLGVTLIHLCLVGPSGPIYAQPVCLYAKESIRELASTATGLRVHGRTSCDPGCHPRRHVPEPSSGAISRACCYLRNVDLLERFPRSSVDRLRYDSLFRGLLLLSRPSG